jgi:predicted phosphodiesterase
MKLGIISGIHEDIVHLRKALADMKELGCEEIVCLGDTVGYNPRYYGYPETRDANGALQLIRENCKYSVVGNHDLFAIQKLPQDRSLFSYPLNWYLLPLEERQSLAKGFVWVYDDDMPVYLSEDNRTYLDSLPEFLVLSFKNCKILFSHYVYPNLTGSATEFDPAKNNSVEEHFTFMQKHGCDVGIFAHDLQGGVRFFSEQGIKEYGFGTHPLGDFPIAFNGPWIANGTEPNGFMILDTNSMELRVLPLDAPPVLER